MPTFDTPNSSGSYDPPDDLGEFKVVIISGRGGQGEAQAFSGGGGGPARKLVLIVTHDGGSYTYYIGEDGEDGTEPSDDADRDTVGGQSPLGGGVQGGNGGTSLESGSGTDDHAGAGGAPSALERDSDSVLLGVSEGGGGGGVGGEPVGGGGGARGGGGAQDGEDATGTGNGGDGGQGDDFDAGEDGQAGGYVVDGGVMVQTNTTTTSESPVVQIIDTPRNVSLAVTGHTDTSVSLELDADNANSWTLHRSTTAGFTPDSSNQITSFSSGGLQTYSDAGLTQGTTYHYVAVASNPAGDTESSERVQTTVLPAADRLRVVDVDGDQADIAWRLQSTDEDGVRVLLSQDDPEGDSGPTWVDESGDLQDGTESFTTSNLLHGEKYWVAVEVFTADVTRRTTRG